jgi:hypothetical protein
MQSNEMNKEASASSRHDESPKGTPNADACFHLVPLTLRVMIAFGFGTFVGFPLAFII